MSNQQPATKRSAVHLISTFAFIAVVMLLSIAVAAETFPRCISGCTANDVEFVGVTADVLGSCAPGGTVETNLWVSLYFNRNKTYCVRFVADVYIDGELAVADLVSEPLNVFSKGAYPDIYFATVSVPCGSSLSLENVQIMWSVDKAFKNVSDCEDGSCAPYGPGSKCTGDQFGTIAVSLPLDALDDIAETDEEVPGHIDVLANDLLGVEPTTIASVENGLHGSTQDNGDGTVTYTPNLNFEGTDTFAYTVGDSDGNFDSATVTVTVYPTNDMPTAADDHSETDENEPIQVDILGNDVDPDGSIDPSSVSIVQQPTQGTLDIDPSTGVTTYVPSNGNCGSDEFSYVVNDNEGLPSNEAQVLIDIRCNENPIANDDAATTDENTAIAVDVAANDSDNDGTLDLSSIQITRPPSLGSISVHPSSGVVTYMPDPLSCGDDTFSYIIADDDGALSTEADVVIAVLCDDPPLAIDDLYNVSEGATLDIAPLGILQNDIRGPDDNLTATLVSDVSRGMLSLGSDGSFIYVHDGSETTSDQFSYYASTDTKDSNPATVSLIIQPVNDPPVAIDDEDSTSEDTPVTIDVLINDSDPDGDVLFVDWVAQPTNGSVANNGSSITYTPDPDFHGTDTFAYAATDATGGQAEATVTVIVTPVNDPPIAQDDSGSTEEDTPAILEILINDSDPDGDSLLIQSVTQSENGTVTNNGSTVGYVPDQDFHGIDTLTYTITDGQGGTSTATVAITVKGTNDDPIALDDGESTLEDTAVVIDVLANDFDPESDPLAVESVTQPEHGTVVNNSGDVTYSPDPDFNGEDTFTYTASDDSGGKAVAIVYITVVPANDLPIAQDDSGSTDEDAPITLPLLTNDFDLDGDTLTIETVSQPSNGSVVRNDDHVVYAPNVDFSGIDRFDYTITDGNGGTATAAVTITVIALNDAPNAMDDDASTSEEIPVSVHVLGNDSDPDQDSLIVEAVTQPEHGSVENQGTHVVYTPDPDFSGIDTFTYTISDRNGGIDTASVTVSVLPVNDPPTAQDDSAITEEDVLVSISVTSNDADPDGDFLLVESTSSPSNGTLLNTQNSVSYIPNPEFNGLDSFTYTVSDGNGGTDTATVTVAVAAVNDPPAAQDDSEAAEEETPVTIDVLSNDSDPDGDALAIQSVTQPSHGATVKDGQMIVYTPEPQFNGVDTFTYTASDGHGGTDIATVTLAVSAVNDPPTAQDDSDATDEGVLTTIDVLANDFDLDGDDLTVQSVTQPDHGTVINNGSDVTYTPDPAFNGIDIFTYTLADGSGETATATVTVAVAAVNDPPIANHDEASTDEDLPVAIDVLTNDSDPDGDLLNIQSVTQPSHGAVVNNGDDVIYTPSDGFSGADSFTYTLSDGNGRTATANVTITVVPVNDSPIAQDDSDTTDEDTPVTIDVMLNDSDPDGDGLSIQGITQPISGSAVISGREIVYSPNPAFSGVDTLTYTVSDGRGGTATANVTIAVAAVNDAPIAQNDAAVTGEDASITILVLSNDSDPEGDALVVESITQPVHGTALSNGSSIIYTPDPNYVGDDTFTYTVSDNNGGTSTAAVSVEVLAVNDAPVAQDDAQTTQEDAPIAINALSNDSDPDGDPLRIESIDQPSHGEASINGSQLVYSPSPGFSGSDSFTYTISDSRGGSDTARVAILVEMINDAPIAQNDSASTNEGELITIPVLANDSDVDGDFLLIESFTQPLNGSILNARTTLSYVPDQGFQGIDSFTYTVSDGNGGSSQATVTISVAEVNEAPFAQDDSAITSEGDSVTILALLNDSDPDGDVLVIESVDAPDNGTATIAGDDLIYSADEGFNGVDTFVYTLSDGRGGTSTATVFVAVAPVNEAPLAQDDSATIIAGASASIPVLLNDVDPDGDPLTILSISQPTHGTVTQLGSDLLYASDEDFVGVDTFAYTVTDDSGSTSTATVTVGVDPLIAGSGGAADDSTSCEGRVVISEIAWAGTTADSRDEWIELQNVGTSPVNLDGWILRWRSSHPSTPEDQIWKVIELSGTLSPSGIALCSQGQDTEPSIQVEPSGRSSWAVSGQSDTLGTGYYVLERRSNDTIQDLQAGQIYDTDRALSLELSDLGEIVMLLNEHGEIVDTANASNLGRNGWVAGSASTRGSMERIDPLLPDTADNWQTNFGLVIEGTDADGHPLRATPGNANSLDPQTSTAIASIEPVSVQVGDVLTTSLALSRQDRRTSGWPWISVIRPGFAGVSGAGGSADYTSYAFSGNHENNNQYALQIDTSNLAAGTYAFWIIYASGEAVYIPVVVSP